jgi:SET domain-containing protein
MVDVAYTKTGLGLVATKEFNKGETIYKVNAKYYKHPPKQLLVDKLKIPLTKEHFPVKNKKYEYTGIDLLINHSCNPNAEYKGSMLIAKRKIKKGWQVTVDYRTFERKSGFECKCNSVKCAKFI